MRHATVAWAGTGTVAPLALADGRERDGLRAMAIRAGRVGRLRTGKRRGREVERDVGLQKGGRVDLERRYRIRGLAPVVRVRLSILGLCRVVLRRLGGGKLGGGNGDGLGAVVRVLALLLLLLLLLLGLLLSHIPVVHSGVGEANLVLESHEG